MGPHHGIIEHWDGTAWTISPSPDQMISGDVWLDHMACNSSSDCWVVGAYNSAGLFQTLIEHWNGNSWTIVPSPNPNAARGSGLESISCVSTSDCWAVGGVGSGNSQIVLIEHWDGMSWQIVAPSGPQPTGAGLSGVSCVSSSDCWAVGTGDGQSLVERWDGSSWISVSGAARPHQELFAVTCVSSADCWAVGYENVSPYPLTLAQHWDGNSWARVNTPGINSLLFGVGCMSSSDCFAVGAGQLMEHWDGALWSILPVCPTLTAVASRKIHGTAGTFDIDLPISGQLGLECRSGGPDGNYEMIFTFGNDLVDVPEVSAYGADVSRGSIGPNPNQYTVDLSGASNRAEIAVTLDDVLDSAGNIGTLFGEMDVLVGDTNGNRTVNAADLAQTKSQIGQPVDATNFRLDINADGAINATDAAIVKSNIGSRSP